MIKTVWHEIEVWYRKNASALLAELNNGVSDQQLNDFEALTGFSLPEDYKSSLQIYNGGTYINGYRYNSLGQTLGIWIEMKRLNDDGTFAGVEAIYADGGEIQKNWWCPGWIPFTQDLGGNLYCVDTQPGENGIFGQIIYWDTVEGPSLSEYKSFLEWLRHYRDDLYRGVYQVDEDGFLIKSE